MMTRGNFVKGMITGAMVGMAVGMILDPTHDRDRRRFRKNAGRYIRSAGSVIENLMNR